MAAYATVDDYIARAAVSLPDGSPRRAQVAARLDDASALIRRNIPTGYEPDPDWLKALCFTVAHRAITNPGGRRQLTVGGISETLGEDGGVYLTDKEVESLQPEDVTDPDADAAYTVSLADGPAWMPDPAWPGGWV